MITSVAESKSIIGILYDIIDIEKNKLIYEEAYIMTEAEELIKYDIEQAEDIDIDEDTIPCAFYGTRVVKRTSSSIMVGYKLIEDYVWTEAYNNASVLGGYSLTSITESMEVI